MLPRDRPPARGDPRRERSGQARVVTARRGLGGGCLVRMSGRSTRPASRPAPPRAHSSSAGHGRRRRCSRPFPSGHTATAVVVSGTATALAVLLVQHSAVRVLALAACPLLVGVMAFSRVELGVHWTTDVVASIVWTTAWLLVCAVALSAGPRPGAGRRRALGPGA